MNRTTNLPTRVAWPLAMLALVAVTAIGSNPGWRHWALARTGIVVGSTPPAVESLGPEHAHEAPQEEAIVLSEQGCWSAGVELGRAERRPFERSMVFPGIVRTCPGRSIVKIPAPLTGIVTQVLRERGEAVVPGQPLFELSLTHEELIRDQFEYLASLQKAAVLEEEIQRLEQISEGIVPQKDVIQRKYELKQLKAEQEVYRQVLELHRLPAQKIQAIKQQRTLVQTLFVYVPDDISKERARSVSSPVLQVQDLNVEKGQHVVAGDTMCVVADHSELQIEGSAFEGEARILDEAITSNRPVSVLFEMDKAGNKQARVLSGLRLSWVDDRVDPESRTLRFCVRLPNEELVYDKTDGQRRFIGRQFKPGQRCKLQVSMETLRDHLVLPLSAVVEDRAQTCIFVQNGGKFVLKIVKALHRDQTEVVIDDKCQITPRDVLVLKGAGQLLAALRSGGALQPTCDCGQQH